MDALQWEPLEVLEIIRILAHDVDRAHAEPHDVSTVRHVDSRNHDAAPIDHVVVRAPVLGRAISLNPDTPVAPGEDAIGLPLVRPPSGSTQSTW